MNLIRERVKTWRGRGYPGVTPITRQLLNHWNNQDREPSFFFCQREAGETLIWLIEASPAQKGRKRFLGIAKKRHSLLQE